MAGYTVTHETPNGTALPIVNVTGGANNQLAFNLFSISADETSPAEQQAKYEILRTTDAGTGGTALTEIKNNPLTSAPVGAAIGGTFGTPPAASDVLFAAGIHQKIPFVLQLYPGREYLSAAAAGDGIEIRSVAASSAFPVVATIGWEE